VIEERVFCFDNSLYDSIVIPGELAMAGATRNPGKLIATG
jgi:hypothetical protein